MPPTVAEEGDPRVLVRAALHGEAQGAPDPWAVSLGWHLEAAPLEERLARERRLKPCYSHHQLGDFGGARAEEAHWSESQHYNELLGAAGLLYLCLQGNNTGPEVNTTQDRNPKSG